MSGKKRYVYSFKPLYDDEENFKGVGLLIRWDEFSNTRTGRFIHINTAEKTLSCSIHMCSAKPSDMINNIMEEVLHNNDARIVVV